jgi:hypothetical protein
VEKDFLKYPVPNGAAKILEAAVELAQKDDVLDVYCYIASSSKVEGAYDYHVASAGDSSTTVPDVRGEPVESLKLLGMFSPADKKDVFLLTTKAFDWAAYHKQNHVGKWWTRNKEHARDAWLTGVTLLTVFLAVLQILDLLT